MREAAADAGTGKPLSPDFRAAMETRLGYDFSRVRVHTDSRTAALMGAKAFTCGEHIWFRPGRGPFDQHLLAHELTHVIQQATGEARGLREPSGGERSRRETLESHAREQSERSGYPAGDAIRPLPVPASKEVVQFDFEEDALRELHRLPSAEEEGISQAERRQRMKVISDRRERLRKLFGALPPDEAVKIRERVRARIKGDLLSERFHDILATATREELVNMLEGAFVIDGKALARVLSGADFCKPFTQAELDVGLDLEIGTAMEHFVNEEIRDFYGDETADLWEAYVTRVPGDSLTPSVFTDPASEIVQGFARHSDTAKRQRQIIEAIERSLPGKCPAMKAGIWTDVDLTNLLPSTELNAPFSFEGVTTIPGLIAGGVSSSAAGLDSRTITGTVRLTRTKSAPGSASVRLRTHLRFIVRDVLDFCPGGMGSPLARFVTVPLSRLEASGLAFDVPFEVHYDGPSIEVELSATAARACL